MTLEQMINQSAVLSGLSSSALLGFLVLVLGYVVWHSYKNLHVENQKRLSELLSEQKKTNDLTKEQTAVYKAANEGMSKFIETHCAKTNDKLEDIEDALKDLDNKLNIITHNQGYSVLPKAQK